MSLGSKGNKPNNSTILPLVRSVLAAHTAPVQIPFSTTNMAYTAFHPCPFGLADPIVSNPSRKQGMSSPTARAGLQLRSLVRPGGELELSLVSVTTPDPGPDDVIVRIDASPINPSDLGLLLAGADVGTARVSGTADHSIVMATIPNQAMAGLAARLNNFCPWATRALA